jgi:hypothetical protein
MPWISASSPLSSASRRPPAADGDHRTTTSFIFPSRHDRTKLFQQSIHLRTWVLLIYLLSHEPHDLDPVAENSPLNWSMPPILKRSIRSCTC